MALFDLWPIYQGRYRRNIHRLFSRRAFTINTDIPLISFTFDDFPQSALVTGGSILRNHGVAGTYYASLGLMGQQSPVGPIFLAQDLNALLEQGHELGCHTFGHCHSWQTSPAEFERSIIENRRAIGKLLPRVPFKTLSYPISTPRPRTKQRAAKHFACCRGGGQTLNTGVADLNYLQAFFLEQSRGNADAVRNLIDQNRRDRGWLIFATHDVCPTPSRFGCTPEFFEDIVQCAVNSGARILPVVQAWEALRASSSA
jgi:peptidoglycan/xylan/chitin deacetylase (PgdA/CDA1 family)